MDRQFEKRRDVQRKRQRQLEIGEDLSRKAKDDHGEDILDHLLEAEVRCSISRSISGTKTFTVQVYPGRSDHGHAARNPMVHEALSP